MFKKYESLGNDVSRRELLLIYRRVYNAFKLMAKSPRYMDILLSDYIEVVDLENPCQFSAITLEISNQVVVCYSGTDDKIVGWHEDFQLLYLDQIPSHKYGLRYLENIYNKTDKRIILCGHSKGANIAMNTLFYTSDEINSRIEKVYCFDGPGVNKTNFDNSLLKNRVEKIVAYIPYKSAVGKL